MLLFAFAILYLNRIFFFLNVSCLLYQWSMDAVEKREFSGKKAKLAAAELAKLSKRVCGESFLLNSLLFTAAGIRDWIQNASEVARRSLVVFGVLPSSVI